MEPLLIFSRDFEEYWFYEIKISYYLPYRKQIENARKFGVPVVVAINRFVTDTGIVVNRHIIVIL